MVPLLNRCLVLIACGIHKLERHKQDVKESVETEMCRKAVDIAWSVGRLEDLEFTGTKSAWLFDLNWQLKAGH